MRSFKFTAIVLGLILLGVVGASHRAQAQVTLRLLSLTNDWKYNQSSSNLLTAWRATAYNDSAWPSGPGIFGFEPDTPGLYPNPPGIQTPFVLRQGTMTSNIITYYLRTHFNFPSNVTAGLTLVASNLVDDGLLMYLNGQLCGSIRVNANVGYLVGATAGPTTEGQWDVLNLPTTNLLKGDNVLAVEVHQSGNTSSDVVFGMTLTATIPTPIVITNQPDSQSVVQGDPVTFEVGVSGSSPTYRWWKVTNAVTGAGQFISGATTNKYTIAVAQASSAGTYFCTISNVLGGARSANAVLSVLVDNYGPNLVKAEMADALPGTNVTTTVTVTFSENIQRSSSTNPDNYTLCLLTNIGTALKITNVPSDICYAITNVTVFTNVAILRTAPFRFGSNYVLTVNGVRDNTVNSNIIAPDSLIPVTFNIRTNFFFFSETWRGYVNLLAPGAPSNNWNTISYRDDLPANPESAWWQDYIGVAYNYFDPSISPLCPGVGLGDELSSGLKTYYFRNIFTVPAGFPTNVTLRFRTLINDGAVYYLNGKEFFRENMAAGIVPTYDTLALGALGVPAKCNVTNSVAVTNLVAGVGARLGTNLVAVELHGSSSDPVTDQLIFFGMDLDGIIPQTPTLRTFGPPKLNYQFNYMTKNFTLSWNGGPGYFLQYKTAIGDQWLDVPNMTNPFITQAAGSTRFFRLQFRNDN